MDGLIDQLGNAQYISTLDLLWGYWQVPMSAGLREKTAFVTPYRLFQFNIMPFGLQRALATFQCMMDQLLQGLEDWTAAYLDDVVVHSVTWNEHTSALRAVLRALKDAGLTAKPSKCRFAIAECIYLGHIVGKGMRPENCKIAALEAFPTPSTKNEVRTVLGLTGYYRRFIPDYTPMAAPLTELTKKTNPNRVVWNE